MQPTPAQTGAGTLLSPLPTPAATVLTSRGPADSGPASAAPPAPSQRPRVPAIAPLLDGYPPIYLPELEKVALLNRVDTKYLLSTADLADLLPTLAEEYLALDVGGRRVHRYRTLYFDTSDFELYRQHLAGRAIRQKVRARTYLDSGGCFFEVKTKNNKGRTVKHRLGTAEPLTALTPEASAFAAPYLPAGLGPLGPSLRNEFARVTLVAKQGAERLTLDVGLQFSYDGRIAVLPGLAIAEVKQSGFHAASPFVQRMRERHLRPTGVSKYCLGVAMLVRGVRHNAFKPKLRAIQKLIRGTADVW